MQYLILRLSGLKTDFDLIINLTGMGNFIVGMALLLVDWTFVIAGTTNYIVLGVIHLLISLWGYVLVVVGLKRILDVPIYIGIILSFLWFALGYPLAVLIMRAPV